jgi:hypothetical protein
MKIGDTVHVWWVDSCATIGWNNSGDIDHTEDNCESIGWLAGETKAVVTIAGHKSQQNNYNGIITIPKVAIKKIRKVKT